MTLIDASTMNGDTSRAVLPVAAEPAAQSAAAAGRPARQRLGRLGLKSALVVLNLVGLYYLAGMLLTERIDDDTTTVAAQPVEGGLRTVDMAAHLIHREVDVHRWVANDPPFYPGHLLDNMAAFQEGVVAAVGRFATELSDQVGRGRSSTRLDPDLERAAGLLRFPPNVWVFAGGSPIPQATSEEQYRAGRSALLSYNRRLAAGEARFEPRPDSLLLTLERITADIGSQAAVLDTHVGQGGYVLLDSRSDYLFYNTKGRLYAYLLLIRELRHDFRTVVDQAGLATMWGAMLASLEDAARLRPIFVSNSPPGSMMLASHLAEQGFFLLRAKTQLNDLRAALAGGR